MATLRQKKVVKALIENITSKEHKSAGQVLKSVGYGTGLQNQPRRVLQSEGVQEELKILGFDPESAKNVVASILKNGEDDGHRLKAADMIFKVHGSYAPDKHVNLNMNETSPLSEKDKKLLEYLKQHDRDTGTETVPPS